MATLMSTFELVSAPAATLSGLCAFLGLDAEPRMLEQRVTSRGALVGAAGFDAGAADQGHVGE